MKQRMKKKSKEGKGKEKKNWQSGGREAAALVHSQFVRPALYSLPLILMTVANSRPISGERKTGK